MALKLAQGQEWVGRNRPPRVQITYKVHTGGAEEMKELPFVVGIMAGLSGLEQGALGDLVELKPDKKVKNRAFVEIDRDNFTDVMREIAPRLRIKTNKVLNGGGTDVEEDGEAKPSSLPVELVFRNMDDFGPGEVVKSVPELRKLLARRNRLSDFLTKLDGKTKVEDAIISARSDAAKVKDLRAQCLPYLEKLDEAEAVAVAERLGLPAAAGDDTAEAEEK